MSLSDMAARQGQALSRVGRLRSGIVTALRRNFAALATAAEAQAGRRLADVDDEIVLAYLDAFLSAPGVNCPESTIDILAAELERHGLHVTGLNLADWVQQLQRQVRQKPRPSRSFTPPDRDKKDGPGVPLGELFPLAAQETATGALPALASRPWGPLSGSGTLGGAALSDGKPSSATPSTVTPAAALAGGSKDDAAGGQPGSLASIFSRPGEAGKDAGERPVSKPGPAANAGSAGPGSETPSGQSSVGKDNGVPGEPAGPGRSIASGQPGSDATATTSSWGTGDGDGNGKADAASKPAEPAGPADSRRDRERGTSSGSATPAVETPGTTAALPGPSGQEAGKPVSIPDLWTGPLGNSSVSGERWTPSPVRARPVADTRASPSAAVAPPEHGSSTTVEDGSTPLEFLVVPLRPQLGQGSGAASSRKKKPGRQLRTQAQPPDGESRLDVPLLEDDIGPIVLDAGMTQALLAAASIPRPVFTRDLSAVSGSVDVVDAWESLCRADPVNFPVRFIAPKSRHRARGSLVFTEGRSGGSETAWWPRCVETYRGARLYEMGVLLNRVGDEIVSAKLMKDCATFRLSTPRGLVGIVVVLDMRLEEGESARSELAEGLAGLLAERLSLVAVLTTSAETGSVETLVATVGELALEHEWLVTAPVVASRSWEYADDRGTTAVLALGG